MSLPWSPESWPAAGSWRPASWPWSLRPWLVYLELPIRGGAIPMLEAELVYGRPDTWDGFASIVAGAQFRGALSDPFGDLPGKLVDLTSLAIRQFGPLAAFVA